MLFCHFSGHKSVSDWETNWPNLILVAQKPTDGHMLCKHADASITLLISDHSLRSRNQETGPYFGGILKIKYGSLCQFLGPKLWTEESHSLLRYIAIDVSVCLYMHGLLLASVSLKYGLLSPDRHRPKDYYCSLHIFEENLSSVCDW